MDLLHSEIKRTFLKFLVPSIGGALVVTLYSFVDTIAIGQGVGPDGTAACAVLLPIFAIATFAGLLCGPAPGGTAGDLDLGGDLSFSGRDLPLVRRQ